jgi:hypothetical protein
MKICPFCGDEFSDEFLFCAEDGSALAAPPAAGLQHQPSRDLDGPEQNFDVPDSNANVAPMLYCSVCSAEYPLTFTHCPLHGAPLTTKQIRTITAVPRRTAPVTPLQTTSLAPSLETVSIEAPTATLPIDELPSEPDKPHPVSPAEASLQMTEFRPQMAEADVEPPDEAVEAEVEPAPASVEQRRERLELRVAAVATVIGLIVFAIIAVYTFVSNAARRPAPTPAKSERAASTAQTSDPLFVQTPQAAQDYQPTSADVPKSDAAKPDTPKPDTQKADPSRQPAAGAMPKSADDKKNQPAMPSQPPPAHKPSAQQAPVSPAPSAPSLPSIPRGAPGRVIARVVRVHPTRIASGVRYDVTFNLQEEAGQTAQLERLMIATYSSSGVNRSQMVPFFHRLGAEGTLTFTVSVEMKGRSEGDWAGRVICTSLGSDQSGRPMRTSFGATVAP